MRSRDNPVLVPMEQFPGSIEVTVQKKRLSASGSWLISDHQGSNRFWTTFLNQEASFFEGVEKMSRKLELAVVFLDIRKIRRGHYEARFTKLFDNAAQTGENEVLLTCIQEMEKEIKETPEFWLWSHKRFKHKRPEQY